MEVCVHFGFHRAVGSPWAWQTPTAAETCAGRLRGLRPVLSPHCPPLPHDPATPVLPLAHSCLAPTHVWLEESNWHFIQHWTMLFPLLSKLSCFSANLALQCILIMAPIQISFLLHIDEFHLLGSPTNPGRETTDVQ